jgi:hypothetical protein
VARPPIRREYGLLQNRVSGPTWEDCEAARRQAIDDVEVGPTSSDRWGLSLKRMPVWFLAAGQRLSEANRRHFSWAAAQSWE